jgi:hypothetical protein
MVALFLELPIGMHVLLRDSQSEQDFTSHIVIFSICR